MPKPKVKKTKRVGGTKYHLLSWNQENSPENWVSEDILNIVAYNDVVDSSEKSCNTLKSRDKWDKRHTVGILVTAKPCGIIVLYEELFGSESLTQVYNFLVQYVANLSEDGRNKINQIVYDDACHLMKYANNPQRADQNEFTRYLKNIEKV